MFDLKIESEGQKFEKKCSSFVSKFDNLLEFALFFFIL
jgi:hypothetical protein